MDWYGVVSPNNFKFSGSSLGDILSSLLAPLFAMAGMIALLFLIWGGIRYMTARGDPKAADAAKSTITSAVIGLLIVLLATAIFFIIGAAFKIDIFAGALAPTSAYAQVDIGKYVNLGGGITIGGAFSSFGDFFTNIVRLALAAVAIIFLAMLVWGGFNYINAGGDPKNADAARQTLTNAGIGLLVVVVSLVIIELITRAAGATSIFD